MRRFYEWWKGLIAPPAPVAPPRPAPAPPVKPAPAPPGSPVYIVPPGFGTPGWDDAPVIPDPAAIVLAVSAERVRAGLTPLRNDARLEKIAGYWAKAMAHANVMSHGDFGVRITAVYPNTDAAENIAEGYPDVPTLVKGWLNSPPHRANIMNPHFTAAGAGAALGAGGVLYFVCDFASI